MKYFEKTTIRVKKSHVIFAVFAVFILITVVMLRNAYSVYEESLPEPMTDTGSISLIQLDGSAAHTSSAVISTSEGDIEIALYGNEAPEAVRIFTECAESGGYSGLAAGLYELGSVFTLDVQTEELYTAELHDNLWPFRGAVCMTEERDIVFINTVEFTDEDKEYLSAEGELYEVRKAFLEHGGVPNYARQYAVFGQVISGAEVLEKIAKSPVDSQITINSVTIK